MQTRNKINLNTATEAQIADLPEISNAVAKRIVEQRETKGRFCSINGLSSVKGVTAAILRSLKKNTVVVDTTVVVASPIKTPFQHLLEIVSAVVGSYGNDLLICRSGKRWSTRLLIG